MWTFNLALTVFAVRCCDKSGPCCHAVSVCLSSAVSVCLSITFMYCIKTTNPIFKIFSPSGSHTIIVFPQQTLWEYSDGDLTRAEIAVFNQYLALGLMTGRLWSTVSTVGLSLSQQTLTRKRHASVNLVYDGTHRFTTLRGRLREQNIIFKY